MQQTLYPNPSFHEYVTKCYNEYGIFLSRAQEKFVKKAYQINVVEQTYFFYSDFYPMSGTNFRQMIHRLKIVDKICNSRPAPYKLKGITIPGNVTKGYRGVDLKKISPDFEKILFNLKHQPPQMHDLRIETITDLHTKLVQRGFKPNSHNNAFTFEIPIDPRFATKVNIYKNKMQVMVGCSQRPISYDIRGFQDLIFYLGQLYHYLIGYANSRFIIQPISEWIVMYYHFNRDGVEISSPLFNYTIADLGNHSLFYMKHFKDGTTRPRYEEHRTPNKTLTEVILDANNTDFSS